MNDFTHIINKNNITYIVLILFSKQDCSKKKKKDNLIKISNFFKVLTLVNVSLTQKGHTETVLVGHLLA